MHRYKRYAELEHASHRVPVPTHTKAAHASSHHRHFNDVTSVAKHDDVSKHADKRTFVAPHPDAPLRHLPNHPDTPVPRRIDPPQQIHILFKADLEFKNHAKLDQRPELPHHQLPASYDLRKMYPGVDRVYDQGDCGSCWALSVLSAIEDKCIMKGNPAVALLHDVMHCFSKHPCDGANAGEFLNWLTNHDAVDNRCHMSLWCSCNNIQKLNYIRVKKESISVTTKINNIKRDILQHGSAVAGILVYDNFKHGKFGPHNIYLDSVQAYTADNRPIFAPLHTLMGGHSVVIVGWGKQDHVEVAPNVFETVHYWICRNSWGSNWGDKGHFKIATSKHNKTVQLEHFYHYKNGHWGGVLTFDVEQVDRKYPIYVYILSSIIILIFAALVVLKLKRRKRF